MCFRTEGKVLGGKSSEDELTAIRQNGGIQSQSRGGGETREKQEGSGPGNRTGEATHLTGNGLSVGEIKNACGGGGDRKREGTPPKGILVNFEGETGAG